MYSFSHVLSMAMNLLGLLRDVWAIMRLIVKA
jgi:hypothetical protein